MLVHLSSWNTADKCSQLRKLHSGPMTHILKGVNNMGGEHAALDEREGRNKTFSLFFCLPTYSFPWFGFPFHDWLFHLKTHRFSLSQGASKSLTSIIYRSLGTSLVKLELKHNYCKYITCSVSSDLEEKNVLTLLGNCYMALERWLTQSNRSPRGSIHEVIFTLEIEGYVVVQQLPAEISEISRRNIAIYLGLLLVGPGSVSV